MTLDYQPTRQRFVALAEYAERLLPKAAGFRWDPEDRKWWTSDLERAAGLACARTSAAASRLREADSEVAAAERRREEIAAQLQSPPGLEYRPFQRIGAARMATQTGTLLGDDMGLGKTVQAIGALNALPREEAFPVVVVCPATLKLLWRDMFARWLVHENVSVAVAEGDRLSPADVSIVNYDVLRRHSDKLLSQRPRTLIADEAHYAKTLRRSGKAWTGSIRAKQLQKLSAGIGRRMFLTGTPATSRPADLWPLLTMLDARAWPEKGFFYFAKKFCGAYHNGYGWDFSGSSNLEELQLRLKRSGLLLRRRKEEVLTELPPKTRTLVRLSCDRRTIREELEKKEAVDWVLGKVSREIVDALDAPAVAFAEVAAVRHSAALRKAGAVADFVRETLETESKVVVFAHHLDVQDKLLRELATCNPVVVRGDTPSIARAERIAQFQEDPSVRVIVGGFQPLGAGVTLTASRTVVFAELDWLPATVSQAEDRVHRIGQNSAVQVYHVVLDGSVDARLAQIIMDKQEVLDAMLDAPSAAEAAAAAAAERRASSRTQAIGDERKASSRAQAIGDERKALTVQSREAVHQGVRLLAGVCDGAYLLDGQGFNRYDARFGHSLAHAAELTDSQALEGLKLVKKYRRQLPAVLLREAGAGDEL